jgi:hypothetical protein
MSKLKTRGATVVFSGFSDDSLKAKLIIFQSIMLGF